MLLTFILLFVITGTQSQSLREQEALRTLFNGTNFESTNITNACQDLFWSYVIYCEENKITSLYYVGINENTFLEGTIPTQIGYLVNLSQLSLSYNNLIGTIPSQIGNLINLKYLDISSNELVTIPTQIGALLNLEYLDISYNKLVGTIPTQIGMLLNLQHLDISHNELVRTIPTQIGMLLNLQHLDISNNELIGTIPTQIGMILNLEYLQLYFSSNNLVGTIPTQIVILLNLVALDISNNELVGTIPTQIAMSLNLEYLHFSSNNLVGSIPTQIGLLSKLDHLDISHNELVGSIPTQIGTLSNLEFLHFSYNKLFGTIPTQIGMLLNLEYLRFSSNNLVGSIPTQIGLLSKLDLLDIGSNQITGIIPTQIADLKDLLQLNLNSNRLSGTIPTQLGNIEYIQKLDISYNSLSGTVPSQIGNLRVVANLDLSYNYLSGEIIFGDNYFSTLLNLYGNVEILVCKVKTDLCIYDGLSNCFCPQNECGEKCCWPGYDINCPSCPSGYSRLIYGGECIDIDECEIGKEICDERLCVNTNGSFICVECNYGQILVNGICEDNNNHVQILGITIGFALFVILIVLVIGKVLHKYFKFSRVLNSLPSQVNWSFKSASSLFATTKGWLKQNDNYMILTILPNTQEWKKVTNLIPEGFDQKLIKRIYAVYNPKLVSQFILSHKIHKNHKLVERFENDKLKDWVLKKYLEYVRKFKWNRDTSSPIIPVFHGTDLSVSKMICENGFANLSTVDKGYYGKGIYFTSSIDYALPYCILKKNPTIIVSFILPGNPFPVTENPKNPNNSLCGSSVPINTQYDSHFVVTDIKGFPLTTTKKNCYDEFVIAQESKVIPAFLLVIGDIL